MASVRTKTAQSLRPYTDEPEMADGTLYEKLGRMVLLSTSAVLLAAGFYNLAANASHDLRMLSMLAGVSAFSYLALILENRSAVTIGINLAIAPILFTLAYASLSLGGVLLAETFLLHALIGAAQIRRADKFISRVLFFWVIFNTTLSLLVFWT